MPQRQMVWFDSFQLLQILFYRHYYFNLNTHYLLFKSLGLVNKKKKKEKKEIATYKWSVNIFRMLQNISISDQFCYFPNLYLSKNPEMYQFSHKCFQS